MPFNLKQVFRTILRVSEFWYRFRSDLAEYNDNIEREKKKKMTA